MHEPAAQFASALFPGLLFCVRSVGEDMLSEVDPEFTKGCRVCGCSSVFDLCVCLCVCVCVKPEDLQVQCFGETHDDASWMYVTYARSF